jgi:glycosyltransferase involved in cell wall biosynthesis
MDKIKILHVIDGGFLGGGQANILSICNNIDKSRFETAIAAKGGLAFEKEVRSAGIEFFPVELPKMLRIKYLKNLVDIQKREKFDIIHTHGGVGGYYGRTLKKRIPEIKNVHTIHGIHYINNENFFIRNISKTIEQYLVQYTNMTICETQNDLLTAIKNKIADSVKSVVISNGINLTKYSNLKKNTALLKSLGLDESHFVVGNISRFDVQKNQKLIIQSAYYLIKKYPDMRFVLVGDGKTMNSMREYAREANLGEYVIFAGEKNNLPDYYSIFDVFVLPSLWEGMPYALLEAMASRKAILCSKIPNLLEVIKNNYSALTFDPNDMDDLFREISALHDNKELKEKISQNAMIESTQYDETEIVKQIEDVYTGVLKS